MKAALALFIQVPTRCRLLDKQTTHMQYTWYWIQENCGLHMAYTLSVSLVTQKVNTQSNAHSEVVEYRRMSWKSHNFLSDIKSLPQSKPIPQESHQSVSQVPSIKPKTEEDLALSKWENKTHVDIRNYTSAQLGWCPKMLMKSKIIIKCWDYGITHKNRPNFDAAKCCNHV